MKKEEIKYFCDICKEETKNEDIFQVNYPIVFTTNQIDGKECKAYIEQKQIDICRHCAANVLKISASGCQGYNEYKIINEDTKWQKLKEWLVDKMKYYNNCFNKNVLISSERQKILYTKSNQCFETITQMEYIEKELEGEDENARK